MKNRLTQKPKTRLKSIIIVSGSLVSALALTWFLFTLGVFSGLSSKAGSDTDINVGKEYWVVENVKTNEAIGAIEVEIQSKISGFLSLKVYNEKKDMMLKEGVRVKLGNNLHVVKELSFLPKGRYLVEISGEDKTINKWIDIN